MISVDEALTIIDAAVETLPAERCALLDAAGRYLAEPAVTRDAVPAFDNSAMDGFAVISTDTAGASEEQPVRLAVVGEAAAGAGWDGEITFGRAARIFTGAPIPRGATAIVPVEQTRPCDSREEIDILAAAKKGQHVRRAGDDIQSGATVVDAGERLDAGALGALAATGFPTIRVYRRPRIGLLVSGDEVVDPGAELQRGQVRDVSTYTVTATLRAQGADVVALGRVLDSIDAICAAVEPALAGLDALISAGGVSMGERDLLRPALARLGLRESFWKIAQRPGKPMVFGQFERSDDRVLYFGLPGNPVSVWTCLNVYVAPMVLKMLGAPDYWPPRTLVTAGEPMETPAPFTYFLRARLLDVGGRLTAYLSGPQGSHITHSMLHNDAFLVVPPEVDRIAPGENVAAMILRPAEFAAAAGATLAAIAGRGGTAAGYMEGLGGGATAKDPAPQ